MYSDAVLLGALAVLATLALASCDSWPTSARAPGQADGGEIRPQTIVLFSTPKIIEDFSDPDPSVAAFLEHYRPLLARAEKTIVIFGVGNSEHVFRYRGTGWWHDPVEWARYIDDWVEVSQQPMNYHQVAGIVQSFKRHGEAMGIELVVYDQVDKTAEMAHMHWRYSRHPECQSMLHDQPSFDIRGVLTADPWLYATRPQGIAAGESCGTFLVDQTAQYIHDLGFDGVLYGNQLGTRGGWLPDRGPGYTPEEAAAIFEFMRYSREKLGEKELMWFDSYNNTTVERDVYSFPPEAYAFFDYILVAGFAVVSFPGRYLDNLESKLALQDNSRIIGTLDYVDPWYLYNTMRDYPSEMRTLEELAIENRQRIDGVVFFANDEVGNPVPRALIESYAARFWAE